MTPLVSVLMSVHNEPAEFIDKAVKSICEQTYKHLEFIIIDDASDMGTYNYLKKLSAEYEIIKLYRNDYNLGLTATLNRGLSLCNGDFIARMDADDYSLPQRIHKQVEYFEKYPDIDILGTGVVSFGQDAIFMSPMNGYSNAQVQSNLFFTSSLCHPSVMIRTAFLEKYDLKYDEAVKKGQDYDLWERSSIYGKLAVLPQVLLYYRLHSNQITNTNRQDQNESAERIIRRRLKRIGLIPSDKEMLCHLALKGQSNDTTINEIYNWIEKLLKNTSHFSFIDNKILAKNLHGRLILIKLKRHILPKINELPEVVSILMDRAILKYKLIKYRNKTNI